MAHPLLILAPLRGVTQLEFRTCLARHFPGFDFAYSPFLSTMEGSKIKPAHLQDVIPEANSAMPVVPQVIGKNPETLKTLLKALRDLGYSRCDLNAGCPWPMIVKRGRGAGLLKNPDALFAMLDAGCSIFPDGFSLKTRLGVTDAKELAPLMERISSFPLAALTVHARTAAQMYEGAVDLERFAEVLEAATMPVFYNGDINSPEDVAVLSGRFPKVAGWMIGRGAAKDPSIAMRIKGMECGNLTKAKVDFIFDYSEMVKTRLFGAASFLGRIKEFWSYFRASFADGDELWRKIRTARSYAEYDAAIAPLRRLAR